MKITIVGTGYVGLVTGTCFAEWGFDVTCVDHDSNKIEALRKGVLPLYEADLDRYIQTNTHQGCLHFTSSLSISVLTADAIFITVGTPLDLKTGQADLGAVFSVINGIAPFLSQHQVVVIKSTVPVGVTRQLAQRIRVLNPDAQFDIVAHPEFLREGTAIHDFMHPDRLVIGTENGSANKLMDNLYEAIPPSIPRIVTTLEAAELIKYTANAFLATKVAFINQISDLCEQCGTDVREVSLGIGLDQRIGSSFLNPGPGFGGSCFRKDVKTLIQTARLLDVPLTIMESVLEANNRRRIDMSRRIIACFEGGIKGKTIAILGLTFKPNTDDLRDSPCLAIIPALKAEGAIIRAYDPKGMENAQKLLPNVLFSKDIYEAVEGADAIVILTEWDTFRQLDFQRIKTLVNDPLLIDLRNMYSPDTMEKYGFTYHSLGRKSVSVESARILKWASG